MAAFRAAHFTGILFAALLALTVTQGAALAQQTYPEFAWGSYLGEASYSLPLSYQTGYACDPAGNLYVVFTAAEDLFPTQGGFNSTFHGGSDIYVARVSNAGRFEWGAYLGGAGDEVIAGRHVHVDSRGNLIIVGSTDSADFALVNAFDKTPGGDTDIFVAKITPAGRLAWSSYLSGTSYDEAYTTAVDRFDNLFIFGATANDFPVKGGFDRVPSGAEDWFLAKVTRAGALAWSTFVGDNGPGDLEWGDATMIPDRAGCAYLVVNALGGAGTLPVARGFNNAPDSQAEDIYVARVTAAGQLAWGAYLGGSGGEWMKAKGVHLDSAGNLLLAGYTDSSDFPTPGGFQAPADSMDNVFIAKVTPRGRLAWASCLGGSNRETLYTAVLSKTDDLFIIGGTSSVDFPTPNGFDTERSMYTGDCFAAKVASSGQLAWSSYLGEGNEHNESDGEEAAVIDDDGNLFLALGVDPGTWPSIYPTPNGFDTEYTDRDVYLAMITASGQLAWGTFIGGKDYDSLNWDSTCMRLDAAGNVVLVGTTDSEDFLLPPDLTRDIGPFGDTFVAVVTPQCEVDWTMLLWGGGPMTAVFDQCGNLSLPGIVNADGFPAYGGLDTTFSGAPVSCVARIRFTDEALTSVEPEDGDALEAADAPTFTFRVSPQVSGVQLAISSAETFPKTRQKRNDGGWDRTLRFRIASGATSWTPTAGQWAAIKRLAGPDDAFHWRLEGRMNRTCPISGPAAAVDISGL